MEQEVPKELHLQPPNFPPVGLSRRMSRAYSSIVGGVRRAQDTDDKSLGKKTDSCSPEVWEEIERRLHIA